MISGVKFTSDKIVYLKKHKTIDSLVGSSKFTVKNGKLQEKEKPEKNKNVANRSASPPVLPDSNKKNNQLEIDYFKAAEKGSEFTESEEQKTFFKNYLGKKKKLYKLRKNKVRAKIAAFTKIDESKKRLYFLTITFPSLLSDSLCYQYFNTFLTKARKENYIKSYIWISERQQKGTIHFHMLVNRFVKIRELNNLMKECLLNGLKKKQYEYDKKTIENYNGVDIDKNRKTKKVINFAVKGKSKILAMYLTKYLTKNDTEFTRLVWHCSRDISNLFTAATMDIFTNEEFNKLYYTSYVYYRNCDYYILAVPDKKIEVQQLKLLELFNQIIYDSVN